MTMQGRDRLLEKLRAIQGAPRAAARAALEKGAQKVVETAKTLAPVDDGALRASIGYTFGRYAPAVRGGLKTAGGVDDPDLSVTIHAGNEQVYYAAFVEFGTAPHVNKGRFAGTQHPGTAARPFFYPAYRMHIKSVKTSVSRALRKAIREGR